MKYQGNREESVSMATKQTKIDIDALLSSTNTDFRMVRSWTKRNIVNPDLMPDLSDEQLVQFMTDMVWSRILHERSTALNRQR